MMAIQHPNSIPVEKKLDISYGDLVYLRGDLGLQAGVGVVVSLERRSFDICDAQKPHRGRLFLENINKSVKIPGVLVYWFKIEKEMWMEYYDLSLA